MKKIIISIWTAVFFCMILMTPVRTFAEGIVIDKEDGNYEVQVSMEGGTGKASVTSPATMTVKNGKAYADLEWSSPYYDYMLIENEKYLPINEEGNSVFEIPVLAFDEPMDVVADTTAMSVPHEIDYQLVFDSASITEKSPSGKMNTILLVGGVIIILCAISFIVIQRKRKNQ